MTDEIADIELAHNLSEVVVPPSPLRLKVCNLAECEARCCYDGIYLSDGEDELIMELVEACPDLFPPLPQPPIIYSEWGESVKGNKTATVPFVHADPDYPPHFTPTRCAFLTNDHRCSLQTASVKLGFHKWTFKPRGCWGFPLHYRQPVIMPPPLPDEPDPDYVDDSYPGYVKFTVCGRHNPDGAPWHETLREEIEYLRASPEDPSWRRFGLSQGALVALARERYEALKSQASEGTDAALPHPSE